MRTKLIRTTALAATAMAAVLSLSACGASGTDSAAGSSSPGTRLAADSGPAAGGSAQASGSTVTPAAPESAGAKGGSGSGSSGSGSGKTVSGKAGSGKTASGKTVSGKGGSGKTCGTNDLTWNATSESQAGGYILVSVKARPGITCVLPAKLPGVAFGSDGTEAGPAEQSVGAPVTLSGTTTAYAGVNPKTTNTDGGKELAEIITTVSTSDVTDPVSLRTGSITVDDPIVTNWHTVAGDAVPGDGLDSQ